MNRKRAESKKETPVLADQTWTTRTAVLTLMREAKKRHLPTGHVMNEVFPKVVDRGRWRRQDFLIYGRVLKLSRNLNRHSSLGRWAQGASHGFRLKVSLLTATRLDLIRPPEARSKPRSCALDSRIVPEHGTVGRALHSTKSGPWELRWHLRSHKHERKRTAARGLRLETRCCCSRSSDCCCSG